MTSFTPSDPLDGRSEKTVGRRRKFPAISGVHLLILATGILAFIANLALLRDGETPLTQMAVSQIDLTPGRRLHPEDLRLTPVDVEESVASGLIAESELTEYQGWVVTGPIASGSLISKTSLRAPPAELASRAMSFPIEVEHAVGGDLIVGDLVDVIRVDEDQARFVATGLTVLDVPGRSEGGLGLSGEFHVVLEVDDRTALGLALALAHAQVELVRSTGSSPVTVSSRKELQPGFASRGPSSLGQDDPGRIRSGDPGGYPPDGERLLP